MAINLPSELEFLESPFRIRIGEGLIFGVSVSQWTSNTPSSATVTIIRRSDEADVTATFMAVNSPSISGTTITLDEILIPSGAELGAYIVTVEFETTSFSPGRPYFVLIVHE